MPVYFFSINRYAAAKCLAVDWMAWVQSHAVAGDGDFSLIRCVQTGPGSTQPPVK